MDENIYCNFCLENPQQFTILLCDHVICSRCLQNNLKKHEDVSMVKCKCGLRTYCNQNSMRLSTSSPLDKKQASSTMINNSSISNFKYGFPQFDKYAIKKDKHYQKSLDSHKKNGVHIQNLHFLKTQPMQFDDSTTMLNNSSVIKKKKNQNTESQQMSCCKQNKSKYLNSMISSTNSQQAFCKNLTKQLKFLNIQYSKAIEECQDNFNKVLKNIQHSFLKVVNGIKRFCLQQIVQTEAKNVINLSEIIKNKYDLSIGKKLNKLNQHLYSVIENYAQKMSRNCRPTVYLERQLQNQQFKSKQKKQQRQIYLTLSPKWKSPQKQVFIKFIQKEKGKVKSKTNQLTKKTLKSDKLRIY